MRCASIPITILAFTLAPGFLAADPWKDESGNRWRWYDDREDREEFFEEREERREEFREELEERRERARERAEKWRDRGGGRAPVFVPSPEHGYVQQPPYEIRPRYEQYRPRYRDDERSGEFFLPPPPADQPGYGPPPRPALPPPDTDDDLDAVYTPFGFYEELPKSHHSGYGPRPRAHGQIGPFRFEVWK